VKTGSIHSETTKSVVPCSILHESDFGACILVPADADIPETFELAVDLLGTIYSCKVVLRSERRVGVSLQLRHRNFARPPHA